MIVVQSEVLFKIYSLKFSSAYLSYNVKYKFLLQCKIEISVFFLQQQKARETKKFVPREYVTVKKKVRGGGEPEELRWLKVVILLWSSFAHRQSFWLVGLTLPVTHKPNVFISLLLEKNDGQLCWNWNFKFLARVQLPPAFRKADCFFFYFEGGRGQLDTG